MTDEQPAPDLEQERALGKMSFMEHLGELRTRIVWALGSAGVGLTCPHPVGCEFRQSDLVPFRWGRPSPLP